MPAWMGMSPSTFWSAYGAWSSGGARGLREAANQDGMRCEQEQYRAFEALLGDDEGM